MRLAWGVLTVTRQMKSTALKSTALLLALHCAVALSAQAADAQESAQQATTDAPPLPSDAVPPSYLPPAPPLYPPPVAPSDAPLIPPPVYTAVPPPAYAPAPPPSYAPIPPPSDAPPMPRVAAVDAADLARRGRQKEIAGVVLMVFGAAATVGGIAMSFDSLLNNSVHCAGHEEHATCTGTGVSELGAGELMLAGGQLAMLAGIPVYVVGRVQSEKARRLTGHFGLQPLVGMGGAGVMASTHIRF